MAPTLENPPCWHKCYRPREICTHAVPRLMALISALLTGVLYLSVLCAIGLSYHAAVSLCFCPLLVACSSGPRCCASLGHPCAILRTALPCRMVMVHSCSVSSLLT